MVSVGIPCSKHEDWDFVYKAYERLIKLGIKDVVYSIEDCDLLRKKGLNVYCVEHEVGVGRSREKLFETLKDVDRILYMDAHVYIPDYFFDVVKLVEKREEPIVVPRIAVWDSYGNLNSKSWADGSYYTYYSLKWVYIYNYKSVIEEILGSNEPMYFVKTSFLRKLREVRGFVYLPYWGFEIFDITISAWRLNYKVINIPIIAGYHLWRPTFPKGRFEDSQAWGKEKWFSYSTSLNINPFTFSIELNKLMYILTHYEDNDLNKVIDKVYHPARRYDLIPLDYSRLRFFSRYGFNLKQVYSRFVGKYSQLW